MQKTCLKICFDLTAGVVLIIMKLTMDIRRLLRVFKPRLLRLRLTMHRWIRLKKRRTDDHQLMNMPRWTSRKRQRRDPR